jgi:hypothetical protein
VAAWLFLRRNEARLEAEGVAAQPLEARARRAY